MKLRIECWIKILFYFSIELANCAETLYNLHKLNTKHKTFTVLTSDAIKELIVLSINAVNPIKNKNI